MTEKNELFPVFLKLNHLSLLIIGGGKVALEKLSAVLLNSPKSTITIVSKEFISELTEFVENYPNVQMVQDAFNSTYLEGKHVVISAINDIETSKEIKVIVNEKGILFNSGKFFSNHAFF